MFSTWDNSKAVQPLVFLQDEEHSSIDFLPRFCGNPLSCQPCPRQTPGPTLVKSSADKKNIKTGIQSCLLTTGWVNHISGFLFSVITVSEGPGDGLGPLYDVAFSCQPTGGQDGGVTQQQAVILLSIFIGEVECYTACCRLTDVSTFSQTFPPTC